MKKVLLLDKPAAAIITNGLATPEEVGVALLTMNKVMQGLIKRFKTELHLNEDESDEWKQALRENSKRRQKIERTEEKRRKRMEMKQQKALGRKRQEWLEENQKGMDLEKLEGAEDTELNVSNTGSWKVEELEIEKDVEEQGDNVQSNTKQIKKRPIPEKTLNKKTNKVNTKKPKLDLKLEKEADEEQEEELESDKEVTNFNTSKMKVEHVSDEEEPEQEEDLVVDPFFITDTGENYLSTAVVKRNQNDEDDNNENKRDLHMIKLNNSDKKSVDFRERRQQNRNNNQRDKRAPNNRNSWNNDKDRSTQNKWNNKQSNGRDKFSQNKWSDKKQTPQDFRNKNTKNTNEEDKLHPSWAAKQKLKPVITGFQGKKITFGDDGDGNNNNSNRPLQQSSKKFESPKPAKTAEDNLHPSWAAKQKLKPTITAFQGKKITFDNDD